MKSLPHLSRRWMLAGAAATLAFLLASGPGAQAASGTWTGSTDANWSTGTNWTSSPGATTGSTSADTATFSSDPTGTFGSITSPLVIDAGRNVKSLTFSNTSGNFVIGSSGGNALHLSNGGIISIGATAGSGITETIAAPLVLEAATSTSAGSYTFSNAKTTTTGNTLLFTGPISGGTTTSNFILVLSGHAGNTDTSIISGPISDGGAALGLSLSLAGSGIWTLDGNNTFTGGVTVGGSSSTLNINSATAIGTGTLSFANGGVINNTSGAAVTLSTNNAIAGPSNGTFTYAGTNDLNLGTGSFSAGTDTIVANGTGVLTIGGTVTSLSGSTGSIKKSGTGTLALTGSLQYSGATTIYGGTLLLSGDNSTYSGGIVLSGSGSTAVLDINKATALGTGTLSLSLSTSGIFIDNSSGSDITLTTNNAQTWNNFTFIGTNSLNLGTGAVTIATGLTTTATVNANTLTVGGGIGGAGSLAKAGNGTLILNGTNTYTGSTAVNAGTLILNGSTSSLTTVSAGTLLVNGSLTGNIVARSASAASAMLGGTGTVNGSVTVGGNTGTSIVDAGTDSSVGILSIVGNVALSTNSVLQFEINSNAGTVDTLAITGKLTLGTNFTASLSGTDLGNTILAHGTTLVLATTTTGIVTTTNGFFNGYTDGSDITIGSNVYQINYGDLAGYTNDLTLMVVAAVPEPSTYVLLGLGGLLLFVVARRQRRLVPIV